jgi:tetratricopeptide (TPR) repeat protein
LPDVERLEYGGLRRVLLLGRGELAYESERTAEARRDFERVARDWTGDVASEPSVEARAYLGVLDTEQHRYGDARRAMTASLQQARTMGRAPLEARFLSALAAVSLAEGRPDEALARLNEASRIPESSFNPELAARIHYIRGQVLGALGKRADGDREIAMAATAMEAFQATLAESHRLAFAQRPSIRAVFR